MKEKLANMPQELVDDLKEIAARMEGQDNYCTKNPIYCVQSRRREYWHLPEYADNHDEPEYILDSYSELHFENKGELKKYLKSEDNTEGYTEDDFTELYYVDYWEDEQWFFSERKALDYIDRYTISGQELRIYVKSLYRNKEMQTVVKLLKYLQE